MKRTVFIFLISLFSTTMYAASKEVQRLEGGIKGGITAPLGSYHQGKGEASLMFGIEGRYNFPASPWDVGIALELTSAHHGFDRPDGSRRWQTNRTLGFMALADYNLMQGRKINPYIGAGLGIGYNDVVGDRLYPGSGSSVLFSPRLGVEIIHHIRLEAEFNICRKGFNNFAFSLGFVLGGRPKKN